MTSAGHSLLLASCATILYKYIHKQTMCGYVYWTHSWAIIRSWVSNHTAHTNYVTSVHAHACIRSAFVNDFRSLLGTGSSVVIGVRSVYTCVYVKCEIRVRLRLNQTMFSHTCAHRKNVHTSNTVGFVECVVKRERYVCVRRHLVWWTPARHSTYDACAQSVKFACTCFSRATEAAILAHLLWLWMWLYLGAGGHQMSLARAEHTDILQ